jgi:hypothetical protein
MIEPDDREWPILYFGNDWDAENRTSSHQMALQLRSMTELVYIECPGLRRPAATARDFRKLFSKLGKTLKGPRVSEGMSIYTLLQLPFHGSALMRWINRRLVKWQVSRIRRRLKRRGPPLLWFVIPHVYFLTKLHPDCPAVYYCIDKYASLPGVDQTAVSEMDRQLTRDADVVFVASETLLEDKRVSRPDTMLSPHGVDFDAFSRAHRQWERPVDLPSWEGPVVGFFGLIESWIDLSLLAFLARRRPDWLLVLIGHPAVDVTELRNLANVALLGKKPFEALPQYGHFFDVCVLPYVLTEQVINSNPIKLREYLAMGKPTVSVRFPHAENFQEVIYLASDHEEFLRQTERALREDDREARERRIDSVRDSTWRARASDALRQVRDRIMQREKARESAA